MNAKTGAGIAAVVIAGTIAAVALYPNSAAFCRRAVECKAIVDYDACVQCANPEREKIVTRLVNAYGGITRDVDQIECVTVLWTAADLLLTTCAEEKVAQRKAGK
jgi:hypothetical protein